MASSPVVSTIRIIIPFPVSSDACKVYGNLCMIYLKTKARRLSLRLKLAAVQNKYPYDTYTPCPNMRWINPRLYSVFLEGGRRESPKTVKPPKFFRETEKPPQNSAKAVANISTIWMYRLGFVLQTTASLSFFLA